jgi:transcriptional regulator with XRE-family HTH domain
LRKQKGNTQEDLAQHLGISIQAVSKWERNEGFPDITLLPAISAYYNITVDNLLGVGEIQIRRRKNELIAKYDANASKGFIEDNVTLMRDAVKEFPNDYAFAEQLIHAMLFSSNDDYLDEIIKIGEQIVSKCTDIEIRDKMLSDVGFAYLHKENREKAKETTIQIYDTATKNMMLENVLTGNELILLTQERILDAISSVYMSTCKMIYGRNYSPKEIIHAYETVIKLYETLYENGDFGFANCDLSYLYRFIARQFAYLKEEENVMVNLRLSAKYANEYDNFSDGKHTSFLIDALEIKREETSKNFTGTEIGMLHEYLSWDWFDFMSESKEFKVFKKALESGYRTSDINGNGKETKLCGTVQMGDAVCERI